MEVEYKVGFKKHPAFAGFRALDDAPASFLPQYCRRHMQESGGLL
jgi:hypothetical protein